MQKIACGHYICEYSEDNAAWMISSALATKKLAIVAFSIIEKPFLDQNFCEDVTFAYLTCRIGLLRCPAVVKQTFISVREL